jgi:hypothetical protein
MNVRWLQIFYEHPPSVIFKNKGGEGEVPFSPLAPSSTSLILVSKSCSSCNTQHTSPGGSRAVFFNVWRTGMTLNLRQLLLPLFCIIYLYTQIHTYAITYVCLYVHMYGCMDVWMFVCLYMYGCIDVWMYWCMDVWMFVCLCMYVCTYVCLSVCVRMHVYMYMHTHTYTHICIHTNIHTYTYIHTHIHKKHIYVHMYVLISCQFLLQGGSTGPWYVLQLLISEKLQYCL